MLVLTFNGDATPAVDVVTEEVTVVALTIDAGCILNVGDRIVFVTELCGCAGAGCSDIIVGVGCAAELTALVAAIV